MSRLTCLHHALLPALLLALTLPLGAAAQEAAEYDTSQVVPPPRTGNASLSPLDIARVKLDDGTYVKVVYASPRKKDREIFGELVPYGEVWRAGANEATELTTTGPLLIDGNLLPAGTYSVFAVPEEDQWTIIFNNGLGQWGAYEYNEALDVLRVEAPATTPEKTYEGFTIRFEPASEGTNLSMAWDDTKVSVPISTPDAVSDRIKPEPASASE